MPRWSAVVGLALAALLGGPIACSSGSTGGASANVLSLMKARHLNEADVEAALKTYTPTGMHDKYLMFASGGQQGGVVVIGVPSMRILKYIAVFTPESWQGYGTGDQTDKLLEEGERMGRKLTWGDSHHPALSETNGDYDGQYLFINDKANARVAVISLKDFMTTQIVSSGLMQADHGSAFVTPNTEYIIEGSQYPAPLGGHYEPISDFASKYRGAVVFWKFDRKRGRIDKSKSFAIELPPYMQDLADSGKLDSKGWAFINSFDTELAHGGDLHGKPPLESGASQNDMDYMHIIHWQKAVQVAQEPGKTEMINGFPVIPLHTAIDEGLLYFVGAPKSPHGVIVSPDGKDIVVNGKLDTHVTVFDWDKMKKLIAEKKFQGHDRYGVPILPFKASIRGQVELGLGPLHTQFDGKGNAYTSLFIESKIAKWNFKTLKLESKIPVHYNVGHICIPGGDTEHPVGHYLVSMNKWAIDRFAKVGPLLPQNFQLIDISGKKMERLYDLPIPLGEPHYAQMISVKKLHPEKVFSPIGIDPLTGKHDPNAVTGGHERIVRHGQDVDVFMTAVRSHFTPDTIRVKQGDHVHLHVTNVEQTYDATHGFSLDEYNIHASLEPGRTSDIDFVASTPGVFPFYCTEFCSALHLEMAGYFLVKPTDAQDKSDSTTSTGPATSAQPTKPGTPAKPGTKAKPGKTAKPAAGTH